jgi:alkanesulfonate monooxygenase SsuD/methylene tetrahydromethanopterin reductase-like flavin-dependent oxidoreductase (luciferase family)
MSSYVPNPAMRFGLVLPSKGPHAGPDSLDAAASVCTELGWSSVWVTDHLMVPSGPEAEEYGSILEALSALTWVAARHEQLKIGTSVLVPAMRDAPLLAKQLATIDVLTKGRLVVGVGVSDAYDEIEYANLGKMDRFRQRGAYLDEAVALWRHLWSGNKEPFEGTFNTLRAAARVRSEELPNLPTDTTLHRPDQYNSRRRSLTSLKGWLLLDANFRSSQYVYELSSTKANARYIRSVALTRR